MIANSLRAEVFCSALAICGLMFPSAVCAQARQFLDAPVIKSYVSIRWNPSTKTMQWQADSRGAFLDIQSDTLFLSKGPLYVTYPMMNPLSVQATASATAVADPGYSVISTLLSSITTLAKTVAPASLSQTLDKVNNAKLPGTPGPCSTPGTDIQSLVSDLYGPDTKPNAIDVKDWVKAIDDGFGRGETGPQAIMDAVTLMRTTAANFGRLVTAGTKDLNIITTCAASATDDTIKGLYYNALLADPADRIQQLTEAAAAASQLADLLTTQFAVTTKWIGPKLTYYTISDEITPTFDKMQNVTVKAGTVALKVSAMSSVSLNQAPAGTAAFSVRRYSSLTPEIGVGVVFGTIKQPTYGTATNAAGQTIVARKADTSLSVNPSVLANFVCRCGTGLLVPMLQLGVATSKDLPAILLGAGVRLFGLGKGDVAIGGGAMFGWYKDLQTLKIGDVITGTNAINSDLGYTSRPKLGEYFAIQYKF